MGFWLIHLFLDALKSRLAHFILHSLTISLQLNVLCINTRTNSAVTDSVHAVAVQGPDAPVALCRTSVCSNDCMSDV